MMPTTIMNENMFTTTPVVTSQSHDHQCPAVLPLAPRPSATLLPPEALSLGPSFPCLDTPPYFPNDLLRSEGDQGGERSKCYRGRSYIQKSRKQRGRTPLAPPAIIMLRPRFSGYTPEITNLSAVSSSNATAVVSLPPLKEVEPSRKHRVIESKAVKGDMQLMQCSCLFHGQENQESSFPRAA